MVTTITVSLGAVSRTVRDVDASLAREEAFKIADRLHDELGGVPDIKETNDEDPDAVFENTTMGPTAAMITEAERRPEPVSDPAEEAPAAVRPVVKAGDVDESAKARIDVTHDALRKAGVTGLGHKGSGGDGEQFYTNGTRMQAGGYATQTGRLAEHLEKAPVDVAAAKLATIVRAEKRAEIVTTAGELARSIDVNGTAKALGYALREQAIRGLLARLESPALGYVLGLRDRIRAQAILPEAARASFRGHHDRAIVDFETTALRADKGMLADVLRHELRRNPDVELRLRVRDAEALRDVYAVVGPAYADADFPNVSGDIVDALPAGTRASFAYDPDTTTWELRAEVWTPTPVEEQAVGEPFEAYVSMTSRDNGTMRFRGGGGITVLRCLNASTYVADSTNVQRVHVGKIQTDVGAMIAEASKAAHVLVGAWGRAREATIETPIDMKIEDAIPGFWRSILREREMARVLPGRVEEHVKTLTEAYFGERRDPDRVVRADFAQAWTRMIQNTPDDVRRDAEAAIGAWTVRGRAPSYLPPSRGAS